MQVSVLGSVGVRRDGADVELGARLRRLLAALAAANGSVVSTDRLIDVVWEGEPPDGAEKTLRTYVTRLRQALDPGRDELIVRRPPGYSLDLLPGELDSEVFDEELERALRYLRAADSTTAAELLSAAVGRWRGPAYAGFADEEWARPESVRLQERLVEARESLVEARLADGLVEQAVADARALVESEPLRERPRALLMRALYSAGRQAEALRVSSSYRRYLAEETGLDPSAEIGELEGRIARRDPRLGGRSQALHGYEVGERIGEGAFAVVHRAVQPGIDRDVAIKIIRAELADQPDFIRRFDFEAQTVARLEHPHIVPLYDYWREPGAAYLVMRWLRGGSVEEALRARGPYSRDLVVRLVDEVSAALDAAHRAGVVHRDVRPANLLLDVDGTTYLADFGIALPAAASDDLPIRSPAYAAPEVLRGEPAGVAADVLSLGVTVFELVTGRLPFADSVDRAEVVRRQLNDPLPPARATRTDLPPAVDEVLARATAKAPDDRYGTVVAFATALRAALRPDAGRHRTEQVAGALEPVENPYVGLHAFDEPDADRFFGREALVTEVVDALERVPAVVVVGASGSGKSSVVRAGVLPAIRRGAVPGSERWFITTMVPGDDPVDALETALLRVAVNPPATLRAQLAEPGGLLRSIRRVLPDDRAQLLLVVDQFEELFTQVEDPDERTRFLTELSAAITHPSSPLRVVATLRADHYDAPLRHPGMADLVTEGTVTVRPMSAEELERAITSPARAVGVQVESTLIAELVAGVGERPAALPLLQFSLTELFDRRVAGVMLLSTHRELGELAGALAARADRIVDSGDPADEADVRRIFGRLVTLGEGVEDTRRRARRSELGVAERTAWLLDAYVTARLLTVDRDPASREPTVEVAHEALLREWPRLRNWLSEDRTDLRTLRAIGAAADAWEAADREAGELGRGGRLEAATDLADRHPDWLDDREREWIAASVEAAFDETELERRRVRRLRSLLAVVAIVAVAALVAGVLAFVQRQEADQNAREADLRRVMAQSQVAADDDPNLALLLALEAYRVEPSTETLGAVVTAGSRAPPDWLGDIENGRAYRRTGFLTDRRLVATTDRSIEVWDVDDRALITATGSDEPVSDLHVSEDRSLVAVGRSDGTWTVFDPELDVVAAGGVDEPITAVRVHPGLGIVALGLNGGAVALASVDGSRVAELVPEDDGDEERGPVTGLAISPDGRYVAAAWGTPFGAQQWDLTTGVTEGRSLGTIHARLLVYSDDELYVVDSDLQGYDRETGRPLREPISGFSATELMQLEVHDGTQIDLIGEGTRWAIDLPTGSVARRSYEPPGALAIGTSSPNREVLAFATATGLAFWSLDHRGVFVDGGLPAPDEHSQYNAISTDGALAVQGGNVRDHVAAHVWSLSDGDRILEDVAEPGRGVRLTERDIVTFELADDRFPIRRWDRGSGSFELVTDAGPGGSTNPMLSADGRQLLYPQLFDGILDVYDIETGALLHRLSDIEDAAPPGTSLPLQPRYTRDGERFVLPATSEFVAVYDPESWELVDLLEPPDGFAEVVFTPDGERAITLSSRGLEIRDPDDLGTVLVGPVPSADELDLGRVLEITEDGQYLKVSLDDGAQLLDATTLERIGRPVPHDPAAWAATLATETNQLATVDDGAMVIWNVELEEWPDLACFAAGRNLTPDEWARFGPRGDYRVTCDRWPAG